MKNLAGRKDCDKFIKQELTEAGIEIVLLPEPTSREVPFSISGRLRNFTFERAWYYWVVKGDVPLHIAKELYADPVGCKDVRVCGHCGCPPPEDWLGGFYKKWHDEHTPDTIPSYHIDSQEGLNLFTAMLRGGNHDNQRNQAK